ncbi:hypothetical protein D3C80_1084310 [compost metagenome]
MAFDLPSTGVQPGAQASRLECWHTLSQQCTDQTRQYVAKPCAGHRRMAAIAQGQATSSVGDQAARALQHTDSVVFLRQCLHRCRSVGLHLLRGKPQQPCCFAGVRRYDATDGQRRGTERQQIQGIGIPDLQAPSVGGRRKQAAPPTGLPHAGPDHQHRRRLDQPHQLIGRVHSCGHNLGQTGQGSANMLAASGQRYHSGAAAQGAFSTQ